MMPQDSQKGNKNKAKIKFNEDEIVIDARLPPPVSSLRTYTSLGDDTETETESDSFERTKSTYSMSEYMTARSWYTRYTQWELPELNSYNVMNWFFFVANVAISFIIGQFGFFGCTPLRVQNETYRVLLSPINWSFYVWTLIYTLEGYFVLAQLHSANNTKRTVLSIKYWFSVACMANGVYTVSFSLGILWLATLSTGICWICLSWIIVTHHFTVKKKILDKTSFLVLGISFHAGWMTFLFVLNFNMLLVDLYSDPLCHLLTTIISMVLLYTIAGLWLLLPHFPSYPIPLVLSWGFFGMGYELHQGVVQRIELQFELYLIRSLNYFSWALNIFILVFCLLRIISALLSLRKINKRKRKTASMEDETDVV
uniref:Uncharacterized protein n=1 Tax=Corethron hystrix TaxID=216773 RepID=A0A7S1BQ12_9STRA|mmetsp:Transcript_36729/g.85812  ORF Transcript_36729/g.85812 Transcript_36729/m.85812 type:complete len:369 (+) Transcript_36729:52-1158(+)